MQDYIVRAPSKRMSLQAPSQKTEEQEEENAIERLFV